MTEIKKYVKNKLKLIEDCAQSFGAKFNNKQTGTFGDFGCFSFFQLKILVVMEMEASSQQIVVNTQKNYKCLEIMED